MVQQVLPRLCVGVAVHLAPRAEDGGEGTGRKTAADMMKGASADSLNPAEIDRIFDMQRAERQESILESIIDIIKNRGSSRVRRQ